VPQRKLFRQHLGLSSRSYKRSLGAKERLRRAVATETLESRVLLSSCGLSSTGVLTLTGDMNAANGTLDVSYSSTGQIMVTCDGGGMYASPSAVKKIVITGGNYSDSVYINPNITIPAVINTYDGNDYVNSGGGNDSITVGNGTDTIYGRGGNDTIVAGNGHDTIYGGTGNDSITAGNGGDAVYGEQDNDTIVTGSGNDSIYGGDGSDSISAGAGNDYLEGDALNDTLVGGDGNDTLVGGTGSDNMNGGTGLNSYPDLSSLDTVPQGTVQSPLPQPAPDTTGTIAGNNNETVTGSNGGDSLAPTPIFALTGVSGFGPHAIFVNGLASQLGSGTVLTTHFQWNFGDPSGQYNVLDGWNASHIYDTPGTYTVTLTLTNQLGKSRSVSANVTVLADTRRTIYVDNNGNDANTGQTPQTAIRTVDRAIALMGSGVRLLFHAGQTFTVDLGISITYQDVLIGSYGSGANPVLYRVAGTGDSIISMYDNANQIVVQNLTMDSQWKPVGVIADYIPANGIVPGGVNSAIRNVTFLNLNIAVDCDRSPNGTLVENCNAPLSTGLRSQFIWGQGSNQVYLGNTAANSTREHIVRTVGTVAQLIAYNNFTNLDRRPLGDAEDYNKGTLDLHRSSYDYVDNNYFYDGELRTGPFGGAGEPPNTGTDWVVIEDNHVFNYSMQILGGTHHLMVRNNVFTVTNDADITIIPSYRGMLASDINIINNTGISNGTIGYFIYMYGGGPAGIVTVKNNLWVAPNVVGGTGTAAILVADTNINEFSSVANNVWQMPTTANSWGHGGVMYVYPSWGFSQGYLTPAQWAAEPNVSHDTFTTTPISSNDTPSSTSIAATAGVAVPGVYNDLFGNRRPLSGSVSAGAVQVGGVSSTPTGPSDPPSSGTGSISGTFFYDSNHNGVWDSGEVISPSWGVYIDVNNDGKYDTGDHEIIATSSGTYTFSGLAAGTYVIRGTTASGWTQTSPANGGGQTIVISSGQNVTGVNIGEYHGIISAAASASISGTFFYDSNHNGVWDSGESISPSWGVYIDMNNDGKYDTGDKEIIATSSGTYTFSGLAAGTYVIRGTTASGWTQTSPANGGGQTVTVSAGQNVTGVNIGEYHGVVSSIATGSISGTFFYDSNHDGVWNSGEGISPLWGVYIDMNNDGKYDAGDREIIATSSGTYSFGGLGAGTYVIRGTTASGWTQTSPANGGAQVVTISTGQNVTGVNFGEYHGTITIATGSISGTFFYDSNANGVWNSGETISPSWGVYIDANNDGKYDTGDKELIASTSGTYTFSGLAAGTYVIRGTTAVNWKQTSPTNGGAQVVTLSAGQNATGVNFGEVRI